MIYIEDSGWWGTTEETLALYAEQQPPITRNLLNVWRYRKKVRWQKVRGVIWLCAEDVADAERQFTRLAADHDTTADLHV